MSDEYREGGTLLIEPTVGNPLAVKVGCACGNCGKELGFTGGPPSLPSPDLASVNIKVRPCGSCSSGIELLAESALIEANRRLNNEVTDLRAACEHYAEQAKKVVEFLSGQKDNLE